MILVQFKTEDRKSEKFGPFERVEFEMNLLLVPEGDLRKHIAIFREGRGWKTSDGKFWEGIDILQEKR